MHAFCLDAVCGCQLYKTLVPGTQEKTRCNLWVYIFFEQLSSQLKSCCQEAEHLMPKLGAECTTKVKDSIWDHRAASDLLHVVQVARLLLRFVLKSPSQFVLAFSTLAPLQQPQHS